MKKIDRFLLAIIAGVVALVVIALALALTRTAQGYLPETTPSNVAHNYLLALKQGDDTRAYGYLAPELKGYPPNVDEFSADIDRYDWQFSRDAATISVGEERITGERAVVSLNETRFYQGGLFSSGSYTSAFDMTLRRQSETWKIVSADSHWAACWATARPCQ